MPQPTRIGHVSSERKKLIYQTAKAISAFFLLSSSASAQIEMINRVPQRTLNAVVVSVSRAKIQCNSDEDGNEMKGTADGTGLSIDQLKLIG
jgi:hypothetical protein